MSARLIILKNAAFNVVRGGASALVALVLPYFLTRALPPAKYGIWVLALQLSAYVNYLDAGIQTAIARFIAQCVEDNDRHRRDQIINSAGLLLFCAMLAGFVVLLVGEIALPHIYRQTPIALMSELRNCMLIVGGSLAIGLPASVFTGILIGYQRNEIPALSIGVSKVAGAAVIAFAARHTQSLTVLAAILAGFNLLSYAAQAPSAAKLISGLRFSIRFITKTVMRELVAYCTSLSAWTIGMLLVSGLDLTLVGIFDFKRVGAYSIGNTLVVIVAGVNSAVFTSLLAPFARLHARKEPGKLGTLVLTSTAAAVLLNIMVAIPILCYADQLLSHWVPAAYAREALPLMRILVIANAMRWSFNPYSIAIIATGQQKTVMITPVLEGIVNLGVSIVGGYMLGALGVAIGTLAGSTVGAVWVILYNVPRTPDIQLTKWQFAREGLLTPAMYFVPACASLIAALMLSPYLRLPLTCIGLVSSSALIVKRWRASLQANAANIGRQ